MKATKIYFKRLFSTGNYENAEIGIDLELNENETAQEAINKAKLFVDFNNPNNSKKKKYETSKAIVENKDTYRYSIVAEAEKFIRDYEQEEKETEDLPF